MSTSTTSLLQDRAKRAITFEGHVVENILCCPKEKVTSLFAGRCYVGADEAQVLTATFLGTEARFRPRD